MADGKQGWKWWQQAALGAGVLVLVLPFLTIGLRKPWIEPLPGVRTAMTRPFVREIDLGPDSAYFLMLEGIRPPAEPVLTPFAAGRGGFGLGGGGFFGAEPAPIPVAAGPEDLFLPEPDPELGWPPEPEPEPEPVRAWGHDWSEALAKFRQFPWPAEPPPPALPVQAGAMGGFGGMGMFGAYYPRALETPWTREQYEDILRLVRLYEPQIPLLDRALAAPDPQMPTADSWSFSLPYLQDVRAMARWLAVSGHYRAGTGDFAGAFRDFERILGLANLVCRGGVVINYLVGIACDAMAAEAAWVVASRERVPAPVLRDAARAFLTAADEAEPFVEAIRAEALLARNGTKKIYRDPVSFYMYLTNHSPSRSDQVLLGLVLRVSPLAGSTPARGARNLDACYQHLVVLAEKPYTPATLAEYGQFYDRFQTRSMVEMVFQIRDPLGLLVAGRLMHYRDPNHLKVARRDASLRGMALFLAVRAYETEHGEPPDTLEALVPDYLPRVPEDPFDGKPLRYLRRNVPGLPPEAWAVYSIGENLTDDGGTAHGVGTQAQRVGTPPSYIPNPDYVWPSVDYPVEKE